MKKQSSERYFKYLSVGVLIICTVVFVISTYGVYRQTDEVDLNSGLLRQRKSVFFIKVNEVIVENEISRFSEKNTPPEWRKVSSVRLWPHSLSLFHGYIDSHYAGVPTDIKNLVATWGLFSFPENMKRETARTYLGILKTNVHSASKYIWQLNEENRGKKQ